MRKICPECGTSNPSDAKLCFRCGAALNYKFKAEEFKFDSIKKETSSTSDRYFRSYLWHNILMTFCCCQPLGILGIIFSSQALSANKQGDFMRADKKNSYSRKCLVWGLVLSFIFMLICYAAGLMEENEL